MIHTIGWYLITALFAIFAYIGLDAGLRATPLPPFIAHSVAAALAITVSWRLFAPED